MTKIDYNRFFKDGQRRRLTQDTNPDELTEEGLLHFYFLKCVNDPNYPFPFETPEWQNIAVEYRDWLEDHVGLPMHLQLPKKV